MDNKVNDLHYAVKFENREKQKYFFIKQNISFFLNQSLFILGKVLTASAFFLPRQILKNIDMPRQKPWHLLTAEVNSERYYDM